MKRNNNIWSAIIAPIKQSLKIVWATILLTWEITSSILALPAWYNAISSESEWIYQKSIDGIQVPIDIINYISEFPDFMDHIINFMELEDKYEDNISKLINEEGMLNKISILKDIWNTEWREQDIETAQTTIPVLTEYEKNKFITLWTVVDNSMNKTIETASATLIAFLFYFFLLRLALQMLRLKDNDTISSSLRKKIYRFISNKQSTKNKINWLDIDNADIDELKNLLNEIKTDLN